MTLYDKHVYTPLQVHCSPLVQKIPRSVNGVDVFTANIVTYARTGLFIPIGFLLRNEYYFTACLMVMLHDFLDHLDGIVAKVHKSMGFVDDPLLGCFLDAFCDKIVCCFSFWTILVLTKFELMTWTQSLIYMGFIFGIFAYEVALGVVRVQDYFYALHKEGPNTTRNLAASMEGKLKEKLESMSIMFLCLSLGGNPMEHWAGWTALVCLFLTIRMAHKSLAHKLKGRN
eukprot:Colp12_sorted_trinity150504_noHs@1837